MKILKIILVEKISFTYFNLKGLIEMTKNYKPEVTLETLADACERKAKAETQTPKLVITITVIIVAFLLCVWWLPRKMPSSTEQFPFPVVSIEKALNAGGAITGKNPEPGLSSRPRYVEYTYPAKGIDSPKVSQDIGKIYRAMTRYWKFNGIRINDAQEGQSKDGRYYKTIHFRPDYPQ